MTRCCGLRVRSMCALVALAGVLAHPGPAPAALGVRHWFVMVPMRDGTYLATDVYLPRVPRRAVPVILVRTPYGRDQIPRRAALLVCHRGRALVVQDMRRRPAEEPSAATYVSWSAEQQDGHDTLGWIARQAWCDGNIGTWGPSALGITQNLFAPDAPDVLKAQYVMFAASNMYDQVAYQGGVLRKALLEGWLQQNRSTTMLPLIREHYKYDSFWEEMNPETRADRVNAPAVFLGGWHDAFLQGTINSFVSVHNHGGPGARGKCRLVIGPWTHDEGERMADPRRIKRLPQAADPFRFLDYWLKCVPSGVPCDKPVHYYVMGDCCDPSAPGHYWRAAENWPPPARPQPFYFHADGTLGPRPPRAEHARLSYRYDPRDPVPTLGGRNLFLDRGPLDQRPVESRPDVLTFTTAPLGRPFEVTGRLLAKLYVSSDCPDTDFTVKLTDVYPNGRSLLLADGILRARFRQSFQREDFLEVGEVYEITVDLWSTSYVFNKRHRIRVAVSSSNAPRFEPNPNTGAPGLDEGEVRVATNALHLSRQYPSHIILPAYGSMEVSDHSGLAGPVFSELYSVGQVNPTHRIRVRD